MKVYVYGMRLRGFSPGAQPRENFIDREDDPLGDYWDVLLYSQKLHRETAEQYDLDFLGVRERE